VTNTIDSLKLEKQYNQGIQQTKVIQSSWSKKQLALSNSSALEKD
jgi:hypothetical protein